jgi:hypothetical protein
MEFNKEPFGTLFSLLPAFGSKERELLGKGKTSGPTKLNPTENNEKDKEIFFSTGLKKLLEENLRYASPAEKVEINHLLHAIKINKRYDDESAKENHTITSFMPSTPLIKIQKTEQVIDFVATKENIISSDQGNNRLTSFIKNTLEKNTQKKTQSPKN